jgi:hypothetical protein
MKIKSSVLFGLVVLICLVGGISLMNRMNDDQGGWRPADMYSTYGGSQGSTYSSVSYGSASSADLSAPMLSSSNSLSRRRGAFSYAPAMSVSSSQLSIAGTASYSQSPIAYNQGLHTTSSAEFRSFGGGGNAGVVSMSGGSIKSSGFSSTAPASVLSVSMPSTSVLAYNNTNADYLSSVSGDIAMASTQAYAGIGNTTGGAMGGISGRKNGAAEDSWLQWLARYGSGFGTVSGDEDNGYTYSFDYFQLQKAYNEYVNNYWDKMWGDPPSFDQWLLWFQGNNGSHDYRGNTYTWVPIGDYYPLLILAMLYVGYVAIRRRKSKISENNI